MNRELSDGIIDLLSALDDVQTYLSIARDSGMQQRAHDELARFLPELSDLKETAAMIGDENRANFLLGLECLARSRLAELNMWMLLKQEKPEQAWDLLISAQRAVGAACRAHVLFVDAEQEAERLLVIEEYVFPPQSFFSAGYRATNRECSICRQEYEECPHLIGLPYSGEFCYTIVREVELLEVSFVAQPEDKRCRAIKFSDDGGMRNKMTWVLEPADRSPAAD